MGAAVPVSHGREALYMRLHSSLVAHACCCMGVAVATVLTVHGHAAVRRRRCVAAAGIRMGEPARVHCRRAQRCDRRVRRLSLSLCARERACAQTDRLTHTAHARFRRPCLDVQLCIGSRCRASAAADEPAAVQTLAAPYSDASVVMPRAIARHVCLQTYEWELQHGAFGSGAQERPITEEDMYVPTTLDEADTPSVLSYACKLTLRSPHDTNASVSITPNLLRVWRVDAQGAIERLSRRLSWPTVRLLFIGHREAIREATTLADAGEEEEAEVVGGGGGKASVVKQGSLFSVVDRDLLWVIADWIVRLNAEASAA